MRFTNEDAGMTEERTFSLINGGSAQWLVRVSDRLRRFVDLVGRLGSFLILPLIGVTIFDVTARKLVWIQIWLVEHFGRMFDSTILQELEWHFHTGLFVLVLGYGYIHNSHVRVDLVREHLSWRKKAWLEFLGCSLFMIPYCLIVMYFAVIFTYDSFQVGEISASTVGLSHRWVIKSVMVFGLIIAALAGIAIWIQSVLVLFAPPALRFELMTLDWPEEEGKGIEGKERITLSPDDLPPAK
jgi:TRAP-type mannitol/chloroaromatic compound transport system permease small subunit